MTASCFRLAIIGRRLSLRTKKMPPSTSNSRSGETCAHSMSSGASGINPRIASRVSSASCSLPTNGQSMRWARVAYSSREFGFCPSWAQSSRTSWTLSSIGDSLLMVGKAVARGGPARASRDPFPLASFPIRRLRRHLLSEFGRDHDIHSDVSTSSSLTYGADHAYQENEDASHGTSRGRNDRLEIRDGAEDALATRG